jgi:hypothetical protein
LRVRQLRSPGESGVTRAQHPTHSRAFTLFKYGTYAILTVNAITFSSQELMAAPHLFRDGVPLSRIIDAFPATVDAWAWLALLWLFELQTSVIPSEKIRGALRWGLHATRALCYALAFYAFFGFLANLELVWSFVPSDIADICSLMGADFSVMLDLPEFAPLDSMDCEEMADWAPFFQLPGRAIITDWETLAYLRRMAWVEVINDAAWLLLVLVLEADVQLAERRLLTRTIAWISTVTKGILYVLLFASAVAWGIESGFQDFVDAVLWLAAFVFIDLNSRNIGLRQQPANRTFSCGPRSLR